MLFSKSCFLKYCYHYRCCSAIPAQQWSLCNADAAMRSQQFVMGSQSKIKHQFPGLWLAFSWPGKYFWTGGILTWTLISPRWCFVHFLFSFLDALGEHAVQTRCSMCSLPSCTMGGHTGHMSQQGRRIVRCLRLHLQLWLFLAMCSFPVRMSVLRYQLVHFACCIFQCCWWLGDPASSEFLPSSSFSSSSSSCSYCCASSVWEVVWEERWCQGCRYVGEPREWTQVRQESFHFLLKFPRSSPNTFSVQRCCLMVLVLRLWFKHKPLFTSNLQFWS